MKNLLCLVSAGAFAAGSLHAVLPDLPTPIEQGGMVHADVTFANQPTGTFSVMLHAGHGHLPMLQPLDRWEPGETFDFGDPWYDALDPAQGGAAFGSRYGILIDTSGSDLLPLGLSYGMRVTSIDPGLTGYWYSTSGGGAFEPVLAEVGDAVLWSGGMWHPVFVSDVQGIVEISLELFVVEEDFIGFVEPTSLLPSNAFATEEFTLTMMAVPEPQIYALLAGLGCLALVAWHHRKG